MKDKMKLLFLGVLSTFVIACSGSSPTAPTPPPLASIAGAWSGTLEATGFPQQAVTLGLTQAGGGVTGTWVVQIAGWSGTVTGTVDTANFSGTFTFNAPSAAGGVCTGNASFSGPAVGATMTWNSPGVTGTCTGLPTGIRLVLQRR